MPRRSGAGVGRGRLIVALAVAPVTVLYAFSLDFLRRGIDSWFDARIDAALDDALELGREALDLRMRQLLGQTERMAEELSQGSPERAPLRLDLLRNPDSIVVASAWVPGPAQVDALRERNGAEEMTLIGADGEVLASSSRISDLVPHLPPEPVLTQARAGLSRAAVIGRGKLSEAGLADVHAEMARQLAQEGAAVDAIYHCPLAPTQSDPTVIEDVMRKPGPGMLLAAAREGGFDLADCWMVGDTVSDMLAGRNAGCRTILVRTGYGAGYAHDRAAVDREVPDLAAAAEIILNQTLNEGKP